jgi:putative hydrolase
LNVNAAAAVLSEIGYLLRQEEKDAFRARAFTRAAAELLIQKPDLARLRRLGGLETIPGVGAGIARVLGELVDTGRSSYLDDLRRRLGDAPGVEESELDLAGYRGDLHAHTTWSDGHATMLEMAEGARARGYEYLGITDHSPRITVVNGLGPERLEAQAREIAMVARETGIALLRGIEVDILEDGSLDLPDETLAQLDLVIASPHVKLRQEKQAMTERMLRAVENPHVDVVGHPTGRRPGSRPGADYDFALVFAQAARRGVALEIDCDPARMDLSPELARLAASQGCKLALDSDAHAPAEFAYVQLGVWMARRAGIAPDRLLNWLCLGELQTALRSRP